MTDPAREALLTDLAERALGAVQPEIDRLRANLTTVFHQLKAAERESEQRLGELLFWEFEYREAMDNYRGEAQHAKQLQAQVRAVEQAHCWTNEDGKRFVFAEDLLAAVRLARLVCTCHAEVVHQQGCDAGGGHQ